MSRSMSGPKSLDDIVPASKGVKMRQKKKQRKPDPELPDGLRRQVIKRDVMPVPFEEMEPPTENTMRMVARSGKAKDRLMEAMKTINRIMNIQVLSENRSIQQQNDEKLAVGELVASAMNVDELSPGEGLLAMATLAVRQGLSLRDAGNRLAYRLNEVEKRLEDVEKKLDKKEPSSG